jgi:hypothetical protein
MHVKFAAGRIHLLGHPGVHETPGRARGARGARGDG